MHEYQYIYMNIDICLYTYINFVNNHDKYLYIYGYVPMLRMSDDISSLELIDNNINRYRFIYKYI
jgi:hypothetical protein